MQEKKKQNLIRPSKKIIIRGGGNFFKFQYSIGKFKKRLLNTAINYGNRLRGCISFNFSVFFGEGLHGDSMIQ